jgi:hypothetical protein
VAIVLVPGVSFTSPGSARDHLAMALAGVSGVASPRPVKVLEQAAWRMVVQGPSSFNLDVLEVSWSDQLPRSREDSPIAMLAAAPGLLAYWIGGLFGPSASLPVAGRLLALFGLSALVMLTWIVALVVLTSMELGFLKSTFEGSGTALVMILLVGLGLKSWIGRQIQLSTYFRDYLSSPSEGVSRAIPRARVFDMLQCLYEHGYEHLVLAAHSHGATIAVDLLGADPPPDSPLLHLVTMGSAITEHIIWSDWLDAARKRAFKHPAVTGWTDVHAPTDRLAGPIPQHVGEFGTSASVRIKFCASRYKRALMATHDLYLTDPQVARLLLRISRSVLT